MHKFFSFLVTLLIFNTYPISSQELRYKISAPELVCEKDGTIKEIKKDVTNIKVSDNNPNYFYKFNVDFIRTGCKCKNIQRCTLMAWRAVRELNHYLDNYKVKNGTIPISNTMLVPGFQYIVTANIINGGIIRLQRRLVLDYGEDKTEAEKQMVTPYLKLLAPDTTYAYITNIVNADLVLCSNITGYYFKWQVLNDMAKMVRIFQDKGSELRIPPNTFQAFKAYKIKCNLIQKDKTLKIANHDLSIMSKGLSVDVPVKFLTVSPDQPVKIRGFVRDFDNLDGEVKTTWSCIDSESKQPCKFNNFDNEFEIESGFIKEGLYTINLEASKGSFKEEDSCSVNVVKHMPSIEIEEIENPINPTAGVEIRANIYEIRSFCKLQWISVADEGYEELDLSQVPGDVGKIREIIVRDDLFLKELEEFSNDTVDKDHDLIIPPFDKWDGLKGDCKYLFRLIVSCPPRLEDYDDHSENEPVIEDQQISADVVVITNAAPMTTGINVDPQEGEAFSTRFQINCEKPEDLDGPILYKFGYKLNNLDVVALSLIEMTTAEIILPFSDKGIELFIEICDIFGSCSRNPGPTVITKLPSNYSTLNFQRKLVKKFRDQIDLNDYYQAMTSALGIIELYKSTNDSVNLEQVQSTFTSRILKEIETWLNDQNKDENNRNTARSLIKSINEFNKGLELPTITLDKLLELSSHLSDVDLLPKKRITRSIIRKKREDSLLDNIINHIQLSEMILSQTNDTTKIKETKQNLIKQLENYMEKLCLNLYKKNQNIRLEFKTLILSLEKINRNSYNNYIVIPFERNIWNITARIKLGSSNYNTNKNKKVCIGKGIFNDYLDSAGKIFLTELFSGDISQKTENSHDVIILLPLDLSQTGNPECMVYHEAWNTDCKTVKQTALYVQCACKYLGYYKLKYDNVVSKAFTTQNSITPTTSTYEEYVAHPNPTVEIFQNNSNSTAEKLTSPGNYETVSYVVIVGSVIGIVILGFVLRRILREDDDDESEEDFDFPKYAQLYDEEMFHDAHI